MPFHTTCELKSATTVPFLRLASVHASRLFRVRGMTLTKLQIHLHGKCGSKSFDSLACARGGGTGQTSRRSNWHGQQHSLQT